MHLESVEQIEEILTLSKHSENPEQTFKTKDKDNIFNTGVSIKKTSKKIDETPIAFFINMLPESTKSRPLLKNPPIKGIELDIAYLVALKLIPSCTDATIPCAVRKIPNIATDIPITHLIIDVINSRNLFNLIFSEKLEIIINTVINPTSGIRTVIKMLIILPESKETIGL